MMTGRPEKGAVITFRPGGLRAEAAPGTDIASAARAVGLALGGACGGAGTCGTCRVRLIDGKRSRTVLACRTRPRTDVTVEVPPETSASSLQILTEGVHVRVEPRPNVRVFGRGGRTWMEHGPGGEAVPLRRSPRVPCGLALDLGTTTLVASLFDLRGGRRLAVEASVDPQSAMGEDVVSRLRLALEGGDGAERLRRALLEGLEPLVRRACRSAGLSPADIVDACAVGNTFMHHCFLGLPLSGLAEAPYSPSLTAGVERPARGLGLGLHPAARLYAPPVKAGFLGSDALAGALAAGLDRVGAPTLYIDLGTNGEMLLAHEGGILGATAAAGPAFEGAQVECGMRASAGAISSVRLADRRRGAGGPARDGPPSGTGLVVGTVGGGPARGIAGSGLVDAVSALLDAGAVDRRGTLARSHPLVERGPSGALVVLSSRPVRVHLSQADIRNLQLAKGAVAAGTRVLLDEAGLAPADLDRVLLAGAFGNYLDRRSALRIGLLPPVETGRVLGLGNAASTGAGMMLVSTDERRRAAELDARIQYIELARNDLFRDLFVECLGFP